MIELLLLSLALASDAFAVAIASGVAARGGRAPVVRIALAFGLAQGLMPFGGWLIARAGGDWFTAIDHWVAFGLLAFLGARMIKAGLDGPEAEASFDTASFGGLLLAALATSIDAAAAGLTLPLLALPVWQSCITIGGVTALMAGSGAALGGRLGLRFGTRAEIAGGLVLILIGVRLLASHLGG
jgi:manganese efflux pump family protein